MVLKSSSSLGKSLHWGHQQLCSNSEYAVTSSCCSSFWSQRKESLSHSPASWGCLDLTWSYFYCLIQHGAVQHNCCALSKCYWSTCPYFYPSQMGLYSRTCSQDLVICCSANGLCDIWNLFFVDSFCYIFALFLLQSAFSFRYLQFKTTGLPLFKGTFPYLLGTIFLRSNSLLGSYSCQWASSFHCFYQ
jgi:hypothetical protein